MYTVVIQHQNGSLISETEIHNDYYLAPQKKLQSATLELEENTAGTFNFTVPKGQYGNGNGTDIDIKNDEVIVYQNVEVDPDKQTSRGKEIWRGYFLENDTEFFNSKAFTCIGELAYLNETIQKDATYKFEGDNDYPEKVFKALLAVHNAKVPAKKQFQPGTITVKADNTASHLVNRVQTDEFTTAYSDHTFDCIKKLIESCGGYLKVRREDGVRYLDWLNTYEANGQTINFGKNLLDYAVNQDVTDLITVLYPFGESQSETVDDGQGGTTTKRVKVNISTASGQNGRMFVTLNDTGSYSPDPMAELGWREGTVDFPNVRDPNNLKRLAINYLKNQWDPELKLYTKIQIKAVDLAYFRDEDAAPIEFLQSVKVTSIPHGITNKVVPVTKMTIPLLQPEQTIYTMSTAMRKTKQISTSVTDHDKDIEKTQETIEDTGSGEEEEGEGEVVIEGKDPTDDWVIGKPTVGKEPSKKGDSEYLKHQKHLKVWYDGQATPYSGSMIPFYENTNTGWSQDYFTFYGGYSDHHSTEPTTFEVQELVGGPMATWMASYISEDIADAIDTPATSITIDDETFGNSEHCFANVRAPFDIDIYYSGPWLYPQLSWCAELDSGGRKNGNHWVVSTMNYRTYEICASMEDPGALNMFGCRYALVDGPLTENERSWSGYLYNDADDGDIKYGLSADYYRPYIVGTQPYKGTASQCTGNIFGSFARGVMPILQRPLRGTANDISSACYVVYGVVNFVYGGYTSAGQPLPGIGNGSASFGVYTEPYGGSNHSWLHSRDQRLCRFRPSPTSFEPEAVRVVSLYEIDEIKNGLAESSAASNYTLMPSGRWWAYAWVCNVGPGENYPFGSDITGGLFVATGANMVRTGCAKWTQAHNQTLEDAEKFAHFPQLVVPRSGSERGQCIYINGRPPGPITAKKTPAAGQAYPQDANRIGHYGTQEMSYYNGSSAGDPTYQMSGLCTKAIGYCKAAYNQITTDEVVENLKYIYKKYCTD